MKTFRLIHRQLGKVIALGLMVLAITGFLLKHPSWMAARSSETSCVVLDPDNSERWFRGTRWGVETSTDRGQSWLEVPMLAPPENVEQIVFNPAVSGEVFALGHHELVVSRNGGRIWESVILPVSVSASSVRAIELSAGENNTLLLRADDGLWTKETHGDWIHATTTDINDLNFHDIVLRLHTGRFAGNFGPLLYDLITLMLILLTVSGTVLFRRKRRGRAQK